ncbi:hypothetical protein K469DRAFT_732432 [Zopfia rhizophila CBS 207.26]|uniref:Uncharacterized protein n=1 Tax=Zopfia rhizophila CBS 207.26 TaxID=1314779 RepID=A0A6A6DD53_9PEZI|nr:hypothetical protein K469DRAFT_732432 [Zopfia rhizophila CBS 207.26]
MSVPTSPSTANAPLPPSALPELQVLPTPLAADKLLVGQLLSKSNEKFTPNTLEDRDYDDVGSRWYKDVILVDEATSRFREGLGANHLISKPAAGIEVGTIEAEEMRVRLLKDPSAALKKVTGSLEGKAWLEQHGGKGEVGFVTAVREVTNASYKRAGLVEAGNGLWEVVREVGGQGSDGKRRGSGLEVKTGSKRDIVGVEVRKVVAESGEVKLGEVLGTELLV